MAFLKELKAIMICEGKSFEQSLFYLLRIKYGYSIKDIRSIVGLSYQIIKRAEEPKHGFKRLPISITKKLLSIYNLSFFDYSFIKREISSVNVSIDSIVSIYQTLFDFSPTKSMLYVHSKINGLSKKEYQKIVRISRVNLKQSKISINEICKNLVYQKQSLSY